MKSNNNAKLVDVSDMLVVFKHANSLLVFISFCTVNFPIRRMGGDRVVPSQVVPLQRKRLGEQPGTKLWRMRNHEVAKLFMLSGHLIFNVGHS